MRKEWKVIRVIRPPVPGRPSVRVRPMEPTGRMRYWMTSSAVSVAPPQVAVTVTELLLRMASCG